MKVSRRVTMIAARGIKRLAPNCALLCRQPHDHFAAQGAAPRSVVRPLRKPGVSNSPRPGQLLAARLASTHRISCATGAKIRVGSVESPFA